MASAPSASSILADPASQALARMKGFPGRCRLRKREPESLFILRVSPMMGRTVFTNRRQPPSIVEVWPQQNLVGGGQASVRSIALMPIGVAQWRSADLFEPGQTVVVESQFGGLQVID